LQVVLQRTRPVDGSNTSVGVSAAPGRPRQRGKEKDMRTEDGPKGRATKRFSAVREDAAAEAETVTVGAAKTGAATGAAAKTGAAARAGTAAKPGAAATTGAAAETGGVAGAPGPEIPLGSGPPELSRASDPETRRRIRMAAESDLEASRYAHWRGTVTFHDVANAWFNMSDPNLTEELRGEFKTIFPGLLDAFAEPRKGIITAYFCRHIRVAAALTDIGHAAGAPEGVPEATVKGPPPEGIRALLPEEVAAHTNGHADPRVPHGDKPKRQPWYRRCIHFFDPAPASSSAIHIEPTFGDPADWKAKEILFHCLSLHYKALEFLTPQPRKICMRMIFGVIATLLGTLDSRALAHKQGNENVSFGSDPAEVATLERELAQAQAYYKQSAQRQAQLEYLLGMLMAIIPAAIITTIVALTAGLLHKPATVAVLGGAIGAVVSVMSRMSSGSIELTPESGKKTIRALGFMRPVIGGVFGAVVYVFLAGGVIDLVTAPKGEAELAFYGGLGFLSGFSERFAQDVIAQGAAKTQPLPDTAHSPAHQ
jgi:hypothetical protein